MTGQPRFVQVSEPNERAFTLSIPEGWIVEGGIFRINPMMSGTMAQSISAKLDMIVKSDVEGTKMVHFLPCFFYVDTRFSGMIGCMFQPGSVYNGMTVMPLPPARDFLWQLCVPQIHQSASNITFEGATDLPSLAQGRAEENMRSTGLMLQYDAAVIQYSYQEQGRHYQERAFTYIQNMGALGGGIWTNEYTHIMRAPYGHLEEWEPVLKTVITSLSANREWSHAETRNQAMMGDMALQAQRQEQYRAQKTLETQRYIQGVNQEITDNHRRTHAEISNDAYLTMTGQEEYVNPYTNRVEIAEQKGEYRWVDADEHALYTDDSNYDPNRDPDLTRTDYRRSDPRPRFPF